jgi:hypothetical protein
MPSDGQVVPSSAAAGIDAAELFGESEGAFGLRPVGGEPAGLPAQVALSGRRQTRRTVWCPDQFPGEPGLVSERCP